ncbi:MerR family transcriptional regulator [Rhizobium sp. S95]|uniref:MerR family transcriptional regulator n=1 Tax=Ciceribacter sichuanensis TaxID=2949647 RepID=A0AAJ1FJB8_9HYPH|nr:MerR family transcriptional regulator [Ciceribacter sp. S95]MCO5957891.1 MerR family transcriptional regulator [Ciceribacter sp. S101]
MRSHASFLNSAEAARRLGISPKALRLYERHGLITPDRTAAGWRTYGPEEMKRAGAVVALRSLGVSLAEAATILNGDGDVLDRVLAARQTALEKQASTLAATVARVHYARSELAHGRIPSLAELNDMPSTAPPWLSVDLPWPWNGERFDLFDIRAINYVVGPLGSGKTRLAHAIAKGLDGAKFVGLDRAAGGCAEARMDADGGLRRRVDAVLENLAAEGVPQTAAHVALVAALEDREPGAVVIDMVEQDLDRRSQLALRGLLRRRTADAPPLFLLTRSNVILDLATITPSETVIFCPANHSLPMQVVPRPGAPGYEALATCLAPPEVRARTEGMIAWMPGASQPGASVTGAAG